MTQGDVVEQVARQRLRSLRLARGWSLDDLAQRAHISPSTLSRIETGHRRIALDQLVVLARALDTTVDALVGDAEPTADDVVIHPVRSVVSGATHWLLSRPDDASGRVVAKMRVPARKPTSTPKVHPGREWFYVLSGTVRLELGGRDVFVEEGQAADFDTMTPHVLRGHGGVAEVLSIYDRHGDAAHLHPSAGG